LSSSSIANHSIIESAAIPTFFPLFVSFSWTAKVDFGVMVDLCLAPGAWGCTRLFGKSLRISGLVLGPGVRF